MIPVIAGIRMITQHIPVLAGIRMITQHLVEQKIHCRGEFCKQIFHKNR